MRSRGLDRIKSIADFPSLVEYLKEDLGWELDAEDVEDLVFEYEPEELGLEETHKVKINEIKQLRPLAPNQPWGIFYLGFEPKRLPVVVLRRILRSLVPKKRASAANPQQAVWNLNDLLFISALGEEGHRGISFAHFKENGEGPPQLQTFSWDERETHLHYLNLNLERLRWPEDTNNVEAWREQWSSAFTTTHRQVIKTSKELSVELAKFARQTRELVREVYGYEADNGALHRLHKSFRTVLIQDLNIDSFADMVAQTIAYGLFSARVTGEGVLGLAHLEAMVPNTNPFLKELFAEFTKLSGNDKRQIDFDELGVSELVSLLNTIDIEAILRDFGRQTGGGTEDPVIYFYEHFLNEYDKQQRVKRGEFYTPKPVVSYIVRSVDKLLRDELGCPDGLADTSTMEWNGQTWPKVMILDPATGTGTFLETVIEIIHETMTKKWKRERLTETQMHAAWNEYVPKHLLPRLHGFELMMAPYAVAHMKLGLKLKQTGYDFETDMRLNVLLTNTLEEAKDYSGQLFADFLAHEARAANRVKRDTPITVVLGNPPYAGQSANDSGWVRNLLRAPLRDGADSYFRVDAKPLGERTSKWLNDDYVKFIRYAQYRIAESGNGVLAFVTNHGYLDNPTFRGMRQSLMQTFSDVFLLDLHGNAKKKETTPAGKKDENVFDIQQGVSIGLLVKQPKGKENSGRLQHTDLWGLRSGKYATLVERDLSTINVVDLVPRSPFYLFVPQNTDLLSEYERGWKITEMMPLHGAGMTTARDRTVIDFEKIPLLDRAYLFRDSGASNEELCQQLGISMKKGWNISKARKLIQAESNLEQYVKRVHYRPFDERLIFYHNSLVWRTVKQVMVHMIANDNLGLITSRLTKGETFKHAQVTSNIIEVICMSPKTSNNGFLFPLYLYPQNDNLLDTSEQRRRANFSTQLIHKLSDTLGLSFLPDGTGDLVETFGPEDVFHYVYAILHCSTYRKRYADFLKRDFPRLPLTSDRDLFFELTQWGEELVSLHLMRSPYLDNPFTTFPQSGSNVMEKVRYVAEEKRVYINKEKQHFDNVPEETWNFRVGGYQVLDKWLKDRKGRVLSSEDVGHYRRVVATLHETRQIMEEIDEVIEAHGGWPLPGSVPAEAN